VDRGGEPTDGSRWRWRTWRSWCGRRGRRKGPGSAPGGS